MSAGAGDTVGVIGFGIMGGAIARNLAAAGRQVVGYDVAPDRQEALAGAIEIAADAGEVAGKAAVILTSLPNPDALLTSVAAIIERGGSSPISACLRSPTRHARRRCCARRDMCYSIAR